MLVEMLILPLSRRMRPKRAINLDSSLKAPTITVNLNGNYPTMNAESVGPVDLAPEDRIEVQLDPVIAEARTTHVIEEVSLDGVPEHLEGLKRESDSVETKVVPIIEAINHGELVVERQRSLQN